MEPALGKNRANHKDYRMDKLSLGVIGCGYWGPKLARNIHEIPDAHLASVADLSDERLRHMKALYPYTTITTNYKAILDNPNITAVVIATPVATHVDLARDSLLAGKHVLVEKPLTASTTDALELIALAEERDLRLMVGHTFEYNPVVERLKSLISNRAIGDVYYINATRVNLGIFQRDINVIWDLAPHDISILIYVLGLLPKRVSAHGAANVRDGIEDVGYLLLYFPNNVMATIHVSWLDPHKIRQITVVGSDKMLVYDDISTEKLKMYDRGVDRPGYSDTPEEHELSYRDNGASVVPVQYTEPLRLECLHFLECIREHRTPRSDGYSGWKVIKVLEAAQRSLHNKGVEEEIVW
jgi:predicted dehydrogenase